MFYRSAQHITLAVLAGGEGTRMGRPKGDLDINGRPILRYLLQRIDWPGPTLLVTAPGRERPPAWYDFDREVIDPTCGLGPLRGVLTALEAAQTEFVVITTVDMPAIRNEQLFWLASVLRDQPNLLGAMIRRSNGDGSHVEPFPSAFRRAAAQVLAMRLCASKYSVHGLVGSPGFVALSAPQDWDETTWLNLNFPSDVTAFLRTMDHGGSINAEFASEVTAENRRAI